MLVYFYKWWYINYEILCLLYVWLFNFLYWVCVCGKKGKRGYYINVNGIRCVNNKLKGSEREDDIFLN